MMFLKASWNWVEDRAPFFFSAVNRDITQSLSSSANIKLQHPVYMIYLLVKVTKLSLFKKKGYRLQFELGVQFCKYL